MPDVFLPVMFSWPEDTEALTPAEKGRLIDALVMYARGYGDYKSLLLGREDVLFPKFRGDVDRARQKREEIAGISRENGRKGGRPRKNPAGFLENPENPAGFSETQKNPTKTKTESKTESESKTEGEGDIKTQSEIVGVTARARRFTPPSVEEVKAYAAEMRYAGFNASRFVDFYASKGWHVGRSPMKDWKAAVRGWASRDKESAQPAKTVYAAPEDLF